uniref:Uncharacterized protein n=1 Tax=Rhizophora mucronata TaxID=61149 RepID=A0A2P2PRG4_RHIMU
MLSWQQVCDPLKKLAPISTRTTIIFNPLPSETLTLYLLS